MKLSEREKGWRGKEGRARQLKMGDRKDSRWELKNLNLKERKKWERVNDTETLCSIAKCVPCVDEQGGGLQRVREGERERDRHAKCHEMK